MACIKVVLVVACAVSLFFIKTTSFEAKAHIGRYRGVFLIQWCVQWFVKMCVFAWSAGDSISWISITASWQMIRCVNHAMYRDGSFEMDESVGTTAGCLRSHSCSNRNR
jgi:hypothetical protein